MLKPKNDAMKTSSGTALRKEEAGKSDSGKHKAAKSFSLVVPTPSDDSVTSSPCPPPDCHLLNEGVQSGILINV